MNITQTLPELPYDKAALAPIITEETFDYHYGKHHATYVNNLAGLVRDTPLAEAGVADIVRKAAADGNAGLFNNAAQHWNHSFFWHCLSPSGGGSPQGRIPKRPSSCSARAGRGWRKIPPGNSKSCR